MASTMKEPSPLTFTYSDQDGEPDHSPGLRSWIQSLQTSTDQQFIINLERISTAKRAYSHWKEIADALATYLLNPNLQHVLVPSSLVDMISGKCGKVLRTKLLPLLPPSVQFKDLTIDLKSLLSVSCYTNKIKCSNPDNQGQEKNVTEFLNELANDSDRVIPVSLTRAIVRASKFICKWRRSKYTAKSRLNEMNENSQQAPNINPQNPKSGINNDPSKIDTSKIDASKIDTDPIPPVNKSTKCCYVCKTRYLRRGYRGSGAAPPVPPSASAPIRQYPRLCPPCADTNWTKRRARVNLTGRYAVVTGGRIKIGFQVVLKLLRDGCHVIATTRFPRNAARDYAQQHDFATWKHRLKLYPLDLKDIAGIYSFVSYVKSTFPHLDILINNAAQTLRRPMDFYRDLLDLEHIPHCHVPALQQAVLASTASLDYGLTGGGAGGGGGGGQAVSRGQSTAMIAVTAPKAIVAALPNQTCRIEEVSEEEDVDNGETVAKVIKLENVGPDLEADTMTLDAQSTPPSTSTSSALFIQEDNISMDTDLVSSSKTPDQMKLDAQSTPPSTSFTVSKQEDNISMDTEPSSKTQDNVFGRQNSEPCVSSVPKYDIMGSGSGRKRALYARQRSSPLNLIKTQTSTTTIRAPSYSSPSSSSSSSIRASSSLSSTSISTPAVLRSSHSSSSSSSSISASSFASPFSMARYFPCGLRDADGQQLDLRRTNTWRAVLGTVSLGELMEVLVVNTVAPFILAKELKGHLSKDREGETEGERGGGKRKREREGERMRETSRWEGERGGGKGERGGGKRKMCWGKMKRERIWETGRGKGERGGGKRKTSSTSSSPSSSTPSSTSSKPTSTPTSTPTQATSTSHTSPSSSTSFSTSTSTSSKPTSTPTSTSTTSSSTSTQTTSAPSSTSSTPTQPTSTPTTSKPTTPPSSASSAPPPPAPHPEALHRRFVVNVSAMEGQFSRRGKNRFHPHTNMAKAALNMMTRTAALEYADHAIYMSAVDTGWVSDERPFHLAQREARRGFRLPLDCVDGAARVLDPIISGLTSTQTPHHAVFLKNYNVYPW